jgi:hypothetical protein
MVERRDNVTRGGDRLGGSRPLHSTDTLSSDNSLKLVHSFKCRHMLSLIIDCLVFEDVATVTADQVGRNDRLILLMAEHT